MIPGLLQRLPEPPRRVAVLRASRIGDFINAYPAFQALRQSLPAAHLTLITLPMLVELARRNPAFDAIEEFPGFPGVAEQLFDARRATRFFRRMQSRRFDLAIQLQGSGVHSNPFVLLIGAKATAGFIRDGDWPGLLDAALPLPQVGHEAERVLALTTFLGIPPAEPVPQMDLWDADRVAAESILAGLPQPWIGIHTTARDLTRRWPLERFVAAAAHLQAHLGGTIVAIGEAQDQETVEQALADGGLNFANLCGQTSLPVSAAVIESLALLVTNDTGPAHLAYALGTPTVTIFGGADPLRYGTLRPEHARMIAHPISCRPCELHICPIGTPCLHTVSVDEVVAAAEDLLSQHLPVEIRSTP
jgi:ADP-heptose:LPS heptosyltransferase